MRVGDFIVAGQTWARIRTLRNEAGIEIEEAGPGTPVEIDGWREQPLAGDEVLQAPDEAKAKSVIDYRLEAEERDKMAEDMEAVNQSRKAEQAKREREKVAAQARLDATENLPGNVPLAGEAGAGPKEVHFIVKADVSGSVEAVVDSISALGNKEVRPVIIRSGVGQLSEFDIEHVSTAGGYLVNFNTEVEPHIAQQAEKAKVPILDHNIIYRLVDDVNAKLSEYLPPLITHRVLGEAEIAQVFEITIKGRKTKNIAGCKVRNGTILKTARVRVMRSGEKVFDGKSIRYDLFHMLTCSRLSGVLEECQEGGFGDEEGDRMRHGLLGLV
jgi:translation initiation factor IF-2